MTLRRAPQNIDAYISSFAPEIQQILQEIRHTIHKAAPNADETISYGMPAFTQHGILVYFAAFKKHIGLYPPVLGNAALAEAISPYAGPKGNLQFSLDQPIPNLFIERIARFRLQQNKAKAAVSPPHK